MSYWTNNTKRITEEPFISIIREEYQEAKRRLNPLLSKWHFSGVKFSWAIKNKKHEGGTCWHNLKRITLNVNYRDMKETVKWSEEEFRLTVRHEICHLVQPNHSTKFLRLLELVEGSRYLQTPVYSRETSKVKPTR